MTATMTTPITQSVPGEAIKLTIPHSPDGYVDSYVPLEWCITPEVQSDLVWHGAHKYWLLVVITHELKEVDRFLFPLLAYKGMIYFRYPGLNTVMATIVWNKTRYKGDRVHHSVHDLTRFAKTGNYTCSAVRAHDETLELLQNHYYQLSRELSNEHLHLSQLVARRPSDPNSPVPPEIDEKQAQIDAIQAQIDQLEADIRRIEAGEDYVEPEEEVFDVAANEGFIAESEAKIATLTVETEAASTAYQERRQDPQYELVFEHNFGVCNRSRYIGLLDVPVPASMFAKPSWKITQWLGTRYRWPYPAKLQCDLRKRALFTFWTGFFLLPMLILLEVLQIVAVLMFLLFGLRGINYRPILHPSLRSVTGVGDHLGKSVWLWSKKSDGVHISRSPVFRVLNPPVLVALALATYVGVHFWGASALLWVLYIPVGVLLVLALGWLAQSALDAQRSARSIERSQERISAKRTHEQAKAAREQAARLAAIAAMTKELDTITCGITAPESRKTALPAERRVQFLYHNVKRRVCKPLPGAR